MSSKDRITEKSTHHSGPLDAAGLHIGVVVSRWNSEITTKLLEGCRSVLEKAGLAKEDLEVVFVPGSFEIPAGMSVLLAHGHYDAVIGLGCVVKGETRHDEYINHAVAQGLVQLNIKYQTPTIFGLLTVEDQGQAEDRAGGKWGNKGEEAAETAIQMARLYQRFKTQ